MPTVTKVRGDRLRIRQCVRQVTVTQAGTFEDINPPTFETLLYTRPASGSDWEIVRDRLAGDNPQVLGTDNQGLFTIIGWDETDEVIYIGADDGVNTMPDVGGAIQKLGSSLAPARGGSFDSDNRYIYYGVGGQATTGAVARYDIDGTSHTQLYSHGADRYTWVKWDPTRNQLYALFSEATGNGSILRMEVDGSDDVTLLSGATALAGLDIDPWRGELYFTRDTDLVKMSLVDFSITTLVEGALSTNNQTPDVALDIENGKVYWVDNPTGTGADGSVNRADLDGSNSEAVAEDFDGPTGVGLIEKEYV